MNQNHYCQLLQTIPFFFITTGDREKSSSFNWVYGECFQASKSSARSVHSPPNTVRMLLHETLSCTHPIYHYHYPPSTSLRSVPSISSISYLIILITNFIHHLLLFTRLSRLLMYRFLSRFFFELNLGLRREAKILVLSVCVLPTATLLPRCFWHQNGLKNNPSL